MYELYYILTEPTAYYTTVNNARNKSKQLARCDSRTGGRLRHSLRHIRLQTSDFVLQAILSQNITIENNHICLFLC